jgi:nucleoside-triphosphatase
LIYIQEKLGGRFLKIFITGESGVGKTTLIEEISKILIKNKFTISGFITKEIRESGKRVGFKIIDLNSNIEKIFASKIYTTPYKFGSYYLNIENLDDILKQSLKRDFYFLIIDEIGKMEFYSSFFKNKINEIMKKDIKLLATLHRDFIDSFKNYGKIFVLTNSNRDKVKYEILRIIL